MRRPDSRVGGSVTLDRDSGAAGYALELWFDSDAAAGGLDAVRDLFAIARIWLKR